MRFSLDLHSEKPIRPACMDFFTVHEFICKGDAIMKNKILLLVLASALVMGGCGTSEAVSEGIRDGIESVSEPVHEETTSEPTEFEVFVNVIGYWNDNKAAFDIETNLPDETSLMVSLRKGDYNTDVNFTAQDVVVVSGGKATCEGFSNKGSKLTGDFDLSVSMSIPKFQSDAVQAVVGTSGEYMTGPLIDFSELLDSNSVSAIFAVSLGDEINVEASDDYQYTTFREDDEE